MRELYLLPDLQPGIAAPPTPVYLATVGSVTGSKRCRVSDCALTRLVKRACKARSRRVGAADARVRVAGSALARPLLPAGVCTHTHTRHGPGPQVWRAFAECVNQARHHLRGGQVCCRKMPLHSAAPATRDHREQDICVRVICDLLSDARPPPPSPTSPRRHRDERQARKRRNGSEGWRKIKWADKVWASEKRNKMVKWIDCDRRGGKNKVRGRRVRRVMLLIEERKMHSFVSCYHRT